MLLQSILYFPLMFSWLLCMRNAINDIQNAGNGYFEQRAKFSG